MKYNTVIFDLDGTLLNTLEDLGDSVNHALKSFGYPERTYEEVRCFVGNGIKELMFKAVPKGTDEETTLKCLQAFKDHYKTNMQHKTAPYNGIIELLETLKSKSMTLSLEDIQGIMDEELNKNPEEMDAELIDLCADVLDNAYFGTQGEVITLENNSEENQDNTKTHAKRIKFSKVFLIAAVFIIIASIAIPVSARYVHNETSDKIVQFFSDHFKMNLREGNQNANYHSNDNVNLISELENAGFDKIILPAAFLNDNYSKEDIRITENDSSLSADVDFKLDNNMTGCIGITKYKSADIGEMLVGQGEIGKQYDSAKQITINGMDVLIFSSSEQAYICYVDNDIDYSISVLNCDLDKGVEIAKTLE